MCRGVFARRSTSPRAYPEHLARLQAAYGFDAAVLDYPVYAARASKTWGPTPTGGSPLPRGTPSTGTISPSSTSDGLRMGRDHRPRRVSAAAPRERPPRLLAVTRRQGGGPEIKGELERNVSQTNSREAGPFSDSRSSRKARPTPPSRSSAACETRSVGSTCCRDKPSPGSRRATRRAGSKRTSARWRFRRMRSPSTGWGALIDAGRAKDAIRPLERAREKNPALLPVYALLIDAYRRTGDSQREGEDARRRERPRSSALRPRNARKTGSASTAAGGRSRP